MRTLLGIIATGLITALLVDNFPWWSCGIIAMIVAFGMRLKTGAAFLMGFVGVALAWGILAGWMDIQNAGLLSGRIGKLFGGLSHIVIVLLTALIGGLVSGLGAMTGAQLADLLFRSKKTVGSTMR